MRVAVRTAPVQAMGGLFEWAGESAGCWARWYSEVAQPSMRYPEIRNQPLLENLPRQGDVSTATVLCKDSRLAFSFIYSVQYITHGIKLYYSQFL